MPQNRIKFTKEEELKIETLLNLEGPNLCRHRTGKKIRNNFRDRGWLRNSPRGNPSKGGRKKWENKRGKEMEGL
jgi:hypothetical protein